MCRFKNAEKYGGFQGFEVDELTSLAAVYQMVRDEHTKLEPDCPVAKMEKPPAHHRRGTSRQFGHACDETTISLMLRMVQ